jgi:sugar phosphate isomerase/epimerase
LCRLASDAGFEGIALDGGVTLQDLPAVLPEALAVGLQVPWLFGPVADAPLLPGKRLPHLAASEDKEERLAAVKHALAMIDTARGLGVEAFALDLGRAVLGVKAERVRRHHDRRELEEGEPGARALRRALDERRARSGRILDACRASLEKVLAHAEREQTQVALLLARSPWGVPSPREAQQLLLEFRGAPLGLVMSPARRATLTALGLGGPAERWPELEAEARLVLLTDAVGASADLAPGLGVLDLAGLSLPPRPAPLLVSGRADTSRAEVARARELADRLRRAQADRRAQTRAEAPPAAGLLS